MTCSHKTISPNRNKPTEKWEKEHKLANLPQNSKDQHNTEKGQPMKEWYSLKQWETTFI